MSSDDRKDPVADKDDLQRAVEERVAAVEAAAGSEPVINAPAKTSIRTGTKAAGTKAAPAKKAAAKKAAPARKIAAAKSIPGDRLPARKTAAKKAAETDGATPTEG